MCFMSADGSGEQIAGWTGVLYLVWDAVMAQLFTYSLLNTLLHSKSCIPLFVYCLFYEDFVGDLIFEEFSLNG